MNDILKKVGLFGIVPVVKIENADDAEPLAKALIAGGLPLAEITFRTDAAAEAIARMAKAYPDMLIGAGTVIIWLKAGALTALATLLVVIAVLAVLISYMMRRATEGGAHARIFLREKEELRSGEDMQVLLGKQGRTTSVLRPAGIGDFDGVRLNVVTEGSFIERDRPIEIVNVDGARIVVRERQSA